MITTYKCTYDNNVELKFFKEYGTTDSCKQMYNFYNGGSLLLREPKKRQIISNLINKNIIDKNKNFIDGGSFIGDTTLPMCLNTNGIIYSIDPGDTNTDIIKDLAELNNIKNIKILNYCLGSTCETLYYNKNIYSINFNTFSKTKGSFEHSIEAISLDELYNKQIIENIDFIHIDVENLENEVLKGSKNLIKMYSPIIIFEGHIKSYLKGVRECVEILNDLNYVTYKIDEDAGNVDDCKNFISIPQNRLNYFKEHFDYFKFIELYAL